MVAVDNISQSDYMVKRGDRLVQCVAFTGGPVALELVDGLDDTTRGAGGFGSTNALPAVPSGVISCNSGRHCAVNFGESAAPVHKLPVCQPREDVAATPAVAASATALELNDRWLCDTGAAFDLASGSAARNGIDSLVDVTPISFQTANGVHTANQALQTNTPGLGPAGLRAYVMHENSPCALSVGQRCMHQGYSFVWIKEKAPCFILPEEG